MKDSQRAASPESMPRITAWSGIAAALIGVVGLFILGLFKPGYDPFISTISELGETGGANAGLASALFILIGLLEIAFAAGLYLGSGRGAAALVGSLLLAVHGLFDSIGSGIFPCDLGGLYESFSGQMHFIVSVVGLISLAPAPFFLWSSFVKEGRFSDGAAKAISALALLIGLAAVAFNLSFFTETLIGLSQRLLYYSYYAWVLVISLNALRGRRSD
jgi:hypothetical membrane protein